MKDGDKDEKKNKKNENKSEYLNNLQKAGEEAQKVIDQEQQQKQGWSRGFGV
jgi:hypothetical protein